MEVKLKMKVNEMIEVIEREKIIAIVRGVEREKLIPLAEAMYRGGIRLIECTYNAEGKIKDEYIAENIGMLSEHFCGRMLVGAGTVLTERQVELTKAAGGGFIISPDTSPEVIRKTKELSLVSIPGALTPTEVSLAHRCGADLVKVFPVSHMGGADYIRTLSAPLSHVKLLAVGGVSTQNMSDYLKAGAVGVGIGSGVVNKKMIDEGNYEGIERLAREYTEAVMSSEE